MPPAESQPFSSLRRFFCANLPHPRLSERGCTLDPDETRHLRKVLRGKSGDRIELFDGKGCVAEAVVRAFESGLTRCEVTAMRQVEPPTPRLTIATAIPKGPRADEMVNLLSQLGCDRLAPIVTTRSEVEPRETKLERFARAAVESAKQSHRAFVMQVEPRPARFEDVLAEDADVKLIATIGDFPVHDLPSKLRRAESVIVAIGPVGDWTDDEVAWARQAGFASWSLGPNVLRVEAAAAAATAVVRYLSGGG